MSFRAPFPVQRHPFWRSFRRQIGIGMGLDTMLSALVSRSRGRPLIFGGAAPYRLALVIRPLGWQNRGQLPRTTTP